MAFASAVFGCRGWVLGWVGGGRGGGGVVPAKEGLGEGVGAEGESWHFEVGVGGYGIVS